MPQNLVLYLTRLTSAGLIIVYCSDENNCDLGILLPKQAFCSLVGTSLNWSDSEHVRILFYFCSSFFMKVF
jgi:hypothetical protein